MKHPIRPEDRQDQVDPEVEEIVRERLASFDEDKKAAVPAREALQKLRRDLQQAQPR